MGQNIYCLEPYPSVKVWGGKRLNLKFPGIVDSVGESWEVSDLAEGMSTIASQPLSDFLNAKLSYLVKFIDTSDNLSIQVHPDDAYARVHENSLGKTECWIILEAEPEAGIYLGFKEGVTKNHLREAINKKEDVSVLLNFYPVKKGDFFRVPAGSIHALGKGILLAEVQQSSGVTYRVWDWDRLGINGELRELHVQKALDVCRFEPEKNTAQYFGHKFNIFQNSANLLMQHRDFNVISLTLKEGEISDLKQQAGRPKSIIVISGQGAINSNNETMEIEYYKTYMIKDGPVQIRARQKLECLYVY